MQMTIRKAVKSLNDNEENGGYWLPNIQRHFVWREEQIEKLFDSVVRNYPISTLLAWKTKSQIKYRRFIQTYKKDISLLSYYEGVNEKTKHLVLDGQQRLQSFYIGLVGSYDKKFLCFNILSGDLALPDETRYHFKFLVQEDIMSPWFKVSELVMSDLTNKEIRKKCADAFEDDLTLDQLERIEDNIDLMRRRFVQDDAIIIQILDSVDNPSQYTEDDVVEIFIRCNAGGTVLGKSDLLFSLLTVSWEDADESISELIDKLNKQGYNFNRDFILKSCLSIIKKGAAYNVQKFREPNTKLEIQNGWNKISEAICDVKDYLYGNTYIRSDKALSSYLMLIPLIYFRYHYKDKWSKAKSIDSYILRSLLCSAFSGSPDNLIDSITKKIDEDKDFMLTNIFDEMRNNGRNLQVSADTILKENYTSKNIHLLFNIWYKDFVYDPAAQSNTPQVDHIFPQALLKVVKDINPLTGKRNLMKYKASDRDRLANLMLLKQGENGPGGKCDKPPEEWFADKDQAYLEKHLIPTDPDFWKLENYELFIEERTQLILAKFDELIMR